MAGRYGAVSAVAQQLGTSADDATALAAIASTPSFGRFRRGPGEAPLAFVQRVSAALAADLNKMPRPAAQSADEQLESAFKTLHALSSQAQVYVAANRAARTRGHSTKKRDKNINGLHARAAPLLQLIGQLQALASHEEVRDWPLPSAADIFKVGVLYKIYVIDTSLCVVIRICYVALRSSIQSILSRIIFPIHPRSPPSSPCPSAIGPSMPATPSSRHDRPAAVSSG